MTKQEITSKVFKIVTERLGIEQNDVSTEKSLVNDLGADSLDVVEIVMDIENGFSITVPDEDAEKISTVGEIVDYVEKATKV